MACVSSRIAGGSFPTSSSPGFGHDPRPAYSPVSRSRSSARPAAAQDTLRVERLQDAALATIRARASATLLRAASDLRLDVIGSDRLPQITFNGQASHQSDVTGRQSDIPGLASPRPAQGPLADDARRRAAALRRRRRGPPAGAGRGAPCRIGGGLDVSLYQLRSDVNSAFYSAFLFEKRSAEYEALVGDLERGSRRCGRGSRPARRWAGMRRRSKPSGCGPSCNGTRRGRRAARRSRPWPTSSGSPSNRRRCWSCPRRSRSWATSGPAAAAELRRRPEFEQFQRSRLRLDKEIEYVGIENRPRIFAFGQAGVGLPGSTSSEPARTRSGRPVSSSNGVPGPGAPRAARRTPTVCSSRSWRPRSRRLAASWPGTW